MDIWNKVYDGMILQEAEKQSSAQISKKGKAKSKTAEKGLSPERMKELADHDARREVRKSEAKKINKKVSSASQLNDAEKERLNKKMENKTVENKIDKLAKKKLREKQLSAQEKELRKQAKSTNDEVKKKELLASAKDLKQIVDDLKASYAPKKKEKAKDK